MKRILLPYLLLSIVGGCGGGGAEQEHSRLYVVRQSFGTNVVQRTLTVFDIEPITGQLHSLDVRFDRGGEQFVLGRRLLFHPDGKYIVIARSGTLRAMSFDDEGGLTLLPKAETSHRGMYTGVGPVLLYPKGPLLHVFNPGNDHFPAGVFVLKMGDAPPYFEMVGGVMQLGCNGRAAVGDADGDFMYCSGSFQGGEILTLTVDAATGALSKLATIPAEESVRALRFHASGEMVYALSRKANRYGRHRSWIVGYHRNPVTGRLSPVVRGTIEVRTRIADIALTPDGRYLYATDASLGHLKIYRIEETGQLTELSGVRSGKGANTILVEPSSRFVYVGNEGSQDVAAFTIAENGLVPMTGSPIALGGAPIGMAVSSY